MASSGRPVREKVSGLCSWTQANRCVPVATKLPGISDYAVEGSETGKFHLASPIAARRSWTLA
jgi:hypothetical protein